MADLITRGQSWTKLLKPNITKFKPAPFELYKTPALKEAQQGVFKGAKFQIMTMKGSLFETFKDLIRLEYTYCLKEDYDVDELKEERINTVSKLLSKMYEHLPKEKTDTQRSIYSTGLCWAGTALTITHYSFDFPHIQNLVGGVTTVDMINLKQNTSFYHCRSTTLDCKDDLITNEALQYYAELIDDDFIDRVDDSSVDAHVQELIFQMTPYTQTL